MTNYPDDDNGECWRCGGEGYVFECFDGYCLDAEVGCDDCTRRCPECVRRARRQKANEEAERQADGREG